MDLPKNEKTFSFDLVGQTTQFHYTGQFTVKCILNAGEKRLVEIEKTRLQNDFINPTDDLESIAKIMATLKYHIISAPEWWNQSNFGANIMDDDILVSLYYKVLDQSIAWREDLLKLKEPAQGN